MEKIEIKNVKEVREFIKEYDDVDFVGFESKFNQEKLLLIGWDRQIEIELNIDFSGFKFLEFHNNVYKYIKTELPKFSNRKEFWANSNWKKN